MDAATTLDRPYKPLLDWLAGHDIDLDLSTLDVDAVYHFNTGTRFVPYVLAGAGYARADLDSPITGTVNGQPVSIDDDGGFTLNAGVGAKYLVNDRFLLLVVRAFAGESTPPALWWASPFISAALWPFLFLLLDDLRARLRIQ